MSMSFAGGLRGTKRPTKTQIALPVTDGLFAYFDANNPNSFPGQGNVWRDLTSKNNPASILDASSLPASLTYSRKYGGHVVFNSADQKAVWLSNSSQLGTTNTVTMMVWINPTANQGAWAGIIMDRGPFCGMQFDGTPGTALRFMWAGNQYTFNTGITIPANQWSLVTVVFTATTITPYLNATAGNVCTGTFAAQTFSALRLAYDNSTRYYNGKYGAAMIYNRSLSAAEVSSMYDYFKTRYSIVSNLKVDYDVSQAACYPGSGTSLADLSGNSATGTLVNGTVVESEVLKFDGTNDYVSFAKPSWLTTGASFSVSFWAKWTTTGTTTSTIQALLDNFHNDLPRGFVIQDRPDLSKSLTFSVNPSQTGATTTFQVGDGTWRHVVATYDGTTSKIYVDGSLNASLAQSAATVQATISIGYWQSGSSRFLNGRISNFQMFSSALSASEVSQIYNASKPQFFPTDFPASISNLEVWLKADAGVLDANGNPITTDNTAVATWEDQTTNRRNVSQATAANRPVLRTGANGLNNLPAISFDGTNDSLLGTWSNYDTSKPYTTFTVMNYATFNDYFIYQYGLNGNSGTAGDGARLLNSSGNRIRVFGNATNALLNSSAVCPSSGTILVTVQHNGTLNSPGTVIARQNGIEVYRDTMIRPAAYNNIIAIGCSILSDNVTQFMPFNGKISEHLYFSKALTPKEINMVEAYLNAKWDCYKFNPSDIANLVLWVDANDPTTVYQSSGGSLASADGDVVGEWRDKSGGGRHLTQSTAANKPVLKKAQINGMDVIRGDGINDRLQQLAVTPNYIVNSSCTIFAVMKQVTTKAGQQRPMGNTNGGVATNGFNLIVSGNTGAPNYWVVRDSVGASSGDITMTGTFNLAQPYVYSFRLNSSGAQSFINGVANVTTTAITNLGTPTVPFTLFQDGTPLDTTFPANTDIAEVIVYSRSLTDQECKTVEAYLIKKWNTNTDFDVKKLSPALWLDANDSSSIIQADSTVSQWSDKSGNSRHLTQAILTQRPAYNTTAFSGKPAVVFDGVNDILSTTSAGCLNVTNVSFFLVMKWNTISAEDIPFGLGQTGQSTAGRFFYTSTNAEYNNIICFSVWGGDNPSSFGTDTGGGHHIVEVVQNGNSFYYYRDGVADSTLPRTIRQVAVNASPINFDGASLGSLQGANVATYYSNISVAEAVIFYTNVADTTRQKIEGYLAHKWGLTNNLPANHPYKNTPPNHLD